MKKNSFFMILLTITMCYTIKAQTCSGTANIPPSGVTNVNGIQVISSSSGSVTSYSDNYPICNGNTISTGLLVGLNGLWSITLTFDQPVNDLILLLGGADDANGSNGGEKFIFNSNGGTVSISSNNSCASTISGNTIISGVGGSSPYFGSGTFKISSPNQYTTLTINGPGGNTGSLIGICSASVLKVKDVNTIENTVGFYPNPVKNNMVISSKEAMKSYKIFDKAGRLLISSPLKGNKQEVNLSSLKTGNYVISIETEYKTVNRKLIKQ